jgi:hypothetical protein
MKISEGEQSGKRLGIKFLVVVDRVGGCECLGVVENVQTFWEFPYVLEILRSIP